MEILASVDHNWFDHLDDCLKMPPKKYQRLTQFLEKNKKNTMDKLSQKRADEIFRDININVNGFYVMNYLAYYSLRLGGFVAWNGHRKRNAKIPGLK